MLSPIPQKYALVHKIVHYFGTDSVAVVPNESSPALLVAS